MESAPKKRGNPYRDANGRLTSKDKAVYDIRANPYHDAKGKFAKHSGGYVKGKDQSSWADEVSRDMENDPLAYGGINDISPKPLIGIAKQQGFDGLPTKGSVDDAIKAGGLEIHRGIIPHEQSGTSAEEIEHKMLNGAYEPGKGNYGNGYYFSTSKGIAEMYSKAPVSQKGYTAKPVSGGRVVRAALHKDAKVVDYDKVQGLYQEWYQSRKDKFFWDTTSVDFKIPKGKLSPELMNEVRDPGHLAALLGYDAIRVPLKDRASDRRNKARIKKKIGSDDLGDEIVVLNRTALVVDWRGTAGV